MSASGLKLLVEDCPAVFRYRQDHPDQDEPTREKEIGTAAHLLMLGVGRVVRVIEFDDYKKAEARAAREAAYADGQAPILRPDLTRALAMADAVRAQPVAADLDKRGRSEVTMIWDDPRTGIRCKARIDRLSEDGGLLLDVKTTSDPSLAAFRRRILDNCHHLQAAHYLDGAQVLTGDSRWKWRWLVVGTDAPHLACAYDPAPSVLTVGRDLRDAALETYRACMETGEWPGYQDAPELIELPGFALSQHEERIQTRGLHRMPTGRTRHLTPAQVKQSIEINSPV